MFVKVNSFFYFLIFIVLDYMIEQMFLMDGEFMNNTNNNIEDTKINSINHNDLSLKRLNQSFEKHIDLGEYKKSDILAYWINDFANYHDNEKSFDSTKLKRYKRGDIIKANLGFNVGRRIRWITLLHCT